jgi:hypothetical protein
MAEKAEACSVLRGGCTFCSSECSTVDSLLVGYWLARVPVQQYGDIQQVAVFSRTWRASARHTFTWLE